MRCLENRGASFTGRSLKIDFRLNEGCFVLNTCRHAPIFYYHCTTRYCENMQDRGYEVRGDSIGTGIGVVTHPAIVACLSFSLTFCLSLSLSLSLFLFLSNLYFFSFPSNASHPPPHTYTRTHLNSSVSRTVQRTRERSACARRAS